MDPAKPEASILGGSGEDVRHAPVVAVDRDRCCDTVLLAGAARGVGQPLQPQPHRCGCRRRHDRHCPQPAQPSTHHGGVLPRSGGIIASSQIVGSHASGTWREAWQSDDLRLGKGRPPPVIIRHDGCTRRTGERRGCRWWKEAIRAWGLYGFHKIAYVEWGAPDNERVCVCVHGLTRNGRDFDALAAALHDSYRLACPDLPGRGRSHWLPVPTEYRPPVYLNDMAALIARLDVDEVDWVGTSLGGLLGMTLAAQPNSPIRKLVLNDVGAFLAKGALQRIAGYVGTDPLFADLEALEAYLRDIHKPFGPLTDAQWRHLAQHSARPDPAGAGLRLHYDPGLAAAFKEGFDQDVELWALWDMISCPVLILRGEESDILAKDTAEEMLTRGPQAELIEFAGVGHAPMLMEPGQIEAVRGWLLR